MVQGEIGKNICDLEFAYLEDVVVELVVAEVDIVLVGGHLHELLFFHLLVGIVVAVALLEVAKVLLLLLHGISYLIKYDQWYLYLYLL